VVLSETEVMLYCRSDSTATGCRPTSTWLCCSSASSC